MPFKQTFNAIKKMGRKDPLKMVFVVLLVSVLPLLVIGTLTEVLINSRAAYPISGATGGSGMRMKFRSGKIIYSSCNDAGQSCKHGSDTIVFYNSTNKIIKDLRIENIELRYPNGSSINPVFVETYFLSSEGDQQLTSIPKVAPGEEVSVVLKPTVTISGLKEPANALITFSGKECTTENACGISWNQKSVILSLNSIAKTAALDKSNKLSIKNQYVTFTADGFVFKKNDKYYYGTKQNSSSAFEKPSEDELLATANWDENGDKVTLQVNIKKEDNSWRVRFISFDNGIGERIYINYALRPNPETNTINLDGFHYPLPDGSFMLVLNPYLETLWKPIPEIIENSVYDLNSDYVFDLKDYTMLVHSYGKTDQPKFVKADINGDGTINRSDYDLLVNQIKSHKLKRYNSQ